MTRFEDLGLAGYERGTGYRAGSLYRPAEITLRGFVRGSVLVAVLAGSSWLLWGMFGERIGRAGMWLEVAALWVWRGWRDRVDPRAGDEYATDEERRKVRRDSVWHLVCAAIWAISALALFVQSGGHGG